MPSTFSPNIGLELQATGEHQGTWGIVANSDFSIIDLNRGGRLNIDVSGSSNITVSTTQSRNVYHLISGVLTGNIDYILPAKGGSFILNNTTSGDFTLTAKAAGGIGTVIPQGTTFFGFVNPDIPSFVEALSLPTTTVFTGATTSGSANAQTLTLDTTGFVFGTSQLIICKSGFTNTNTVTLALNGGGAKNIYKETRSGPAALVTGDIQNAQMMALLTDGTQYQLLNPSLGTMAYQNADAVAITGGTIINLDTPLAAADGGTGSTTPLGTAAYEDVGTSANNVVQLNGSAKLPAVDGSQLTNLNQAPGTVGAWVNFNGTGTVAIRDSLNVSSITDNAIGNYTINTVFLNANYAASLAVEAQISNTGPLIANYSQGGTYSSSALQIVIQGPGGTDADAVFITAIFAGDV